MYRDRFERCIEFFIKKFKTPLLWTQCLNFKITNSTAFKIHITSLHLFFCSQKTKEKKSRKQQLQKKPKAGMDFSQWNMFCIFFVSLPSSPSCCSCSKRIYSSRSKARSSPGSSLHRGEDGEDDRGGASEEGKGEGKAWRGAAPGLLVSSDKPEGHFFSERLRPGPPSPSGRVTLFPWLRRHSCSFSLSRAVFYRKR